MNTRPAKSPFTANEETIVAGTAISALRWAWSEFADRCCVLASMQTATVIDLAMQVDRRFPIVFLDTGYHFDETWDTLRRVEQTYGIAVERVGPLTPARADVQPGACCDSKAELLELALRDRDAWVSGIRRSQTEHRKAVSVIDSDHAGRIKINPLAQWSDEDVDRYSTARGIVHNPLLDLGIPSIGCEPCTTLPTDDADIRSGRWSDTDRVECGLHLAPESLSTK